MMNIKVTKRNGKKEPLMLDKILERINQQTYGLDGKWIQPFDIAQKVIEGSEVPTFNTLTLFHIPEGKGKWHYVSHVNPGVTSNRIAYSGWYTV